MRLAPQTEDIHHGFDRGSARGTYRKSVANTDGLGNYSGKGLE